VEREVACDIGSGFKGIVFVGEAGMFSIFDDAGMVFCTGLGISSKLDASSSSSNSSSWNFEAIAAMDPFCSDMVGGGARWTGVGAGSSFLGAGAFTGAGVGAGGL